MDLINLYDAFIFSNTNRIGFEITSDILVMHLFNDIHLQSGLTIEFDGSNNAISLKKYYNGNISLINQISFSHV